jgi:hypothetical protein
LLVESKVLEFDIKVNVTGPSYFFILRKKLASLQVSQENLRLIFDLEHIVSSKESPLKYFPKLKSKLKIIGYSQSRLHILKADTYFVPKENRLSRAAIFQIGKIISEISVLNQDNSSSELTNFKTKFMERYSLRFRW